MAFLFLAFIQHILDDMSDLACETLGNKNIYLITCFPKLIPRFSIVIILLVYECILLVKCSIIQCMEIHCVRLLFNLNMFNIFICMDIFTDVQSYHQIKINYS